MKFRTRKGDTVCTCGLKLTEAETVGLGALGIERLEKLSELGSGLLSYNVGTQSGPLTLMNRHAALKIRQSEI